MFYLPPLGTISNSYHYKNMSSLLNPIEMKIIEVLTENLNPTHLEVINESYMHNVPKGSETHFKVLVVSNEFNKTTLIQVSG